MRGKLSVLGALQRLNHCGDGRPSLDLNILTPPKWLPTCAVGRQGWRQRNPWTRASEHP